MFSCGPSLTLTLALLNSASGVDVCVPTRGASKRVCVFPVKDGGSDTAGAALAAALVWGMGEGGMIWGWWGMGIRGCTGPSAAFRASCVCVRVACVCVVCVGPP